MEFRKAMMASAGLHAGLLLAGLVALPSPRANNTPTINSIPIELVEISEEPQMAGERDGQRQETPQVRTAPNARPQPTPEPIERARPVEAQSTPTPPPPPPPRVAEPPPPTPPTPPPPPRPQQAQPAPPQPVDPDGMRRLVEQQQRQEQQRQEQQRQEQARREEQQRREQQQRQEQARREEQQRQQAEQRRQQQEAQRRAQEEQRRRDEQRQFDANQIANLLNRQQGNPAPTGQRSNETQRQAALGNPQGTGRRLTQSQTAALVGMIQEQITPCWSPPIGRADPGAVRVQIQIAMNPDGTLNGRPRVMNSSNAPDFRAVADSAVRAIQRCAPLRLPAEMYDAANGWRQIEFMFDPSQLG